MLLWRARNAILGEAGAQPTPLSRATAFLYTDYTPRAFWCTPASPPPRSPRAHLASPLTVRRLPDGAACAQPVPPLSAYLLRL